MVFYLFIMTIYPSSDTQSSYCLLSMYEFSLFSFLLNLSISQPPTIFKLFFSLNHMCVFCKLIPFSFQTSFDRMYKNNLSRTFYIFLFFLMLQLYLENLFYIFLFMYRMYYILRIQNPGLISFCTFIYIA